jgi:5'(3')-deoxyribonucleotidase
MKTFVDLDGVVADYDNGFKHLTGRYPNEVSDQEMWDLLIKNSNGAGFYRQLKPMPDAGELWGYLVVHGYEPRILTGIPRRVSIPTAEADKAEWVRVNLGGWVEFNIGPYAIDKQKHCTPGDILIDDNEKNIAQWKAKGGIGIFHTNAANTIKELELLND